MAVWQFDFYLINKDKINLYDESKQWGDDENEYLLSWNSLEINAEEINRISKILIPNKNWSDKTIQFGKIDETCLEITTFSENDSQIFMRLDLRNLNRELLYEIVSFIKANNAYIVYYNKCYPAEEDILLGLLRGSNAYKFCKNPELLLTSFDTKNVSYNN